MSKLKKMLVVVAVLAGSLVATAGAEAGYRYHPHPRVNYGGYPSSYGSGYSFNYTSAWSGNGWNAYYSSSWSPNGWNVYYNSGTGYGGVNYSVGYGAGCR